MLIYFPTSISIHESIEPLPGASCLASCYPGLKFSKSLGSETSMGDGSILSFWIRLDMVQIHESGRDQLILGFLGTSLPSLTGVVGTLSACRPTIRNRILGLFFSSRRSVFTIAASPPISNMGVSQQVANTRRIGEPSRIKHTCNRSPPLCNLISLGYSRKEDPSRGHELEYEFMGTKILKGWIW